MSGLLPSLGDFQGLSAANGGVVAGDDHLRQSLRDILTTPKGSRVMRRDYGCGLFDRIDAPMSPGFVADLVADAAEAILKWEPRVTLKRVVVRALAAGNLDLDLVVVLNGKTIVLEGVV